ncbi:ATP-binding protein [Magnetococcus sp. PR-3]|uniref:ATP-binding protein n=1 Tax=Magnetococcus sp. PR-3 TaxID=3120355 RepID=UPI002FCE6569
MSSHEQKRMEPYPTAPLPLVVRSMRAVRQCQDRRPGQPGMVVLYGLSGLGKSTSAEMIAIKERAIYVEAGESWNKKFLLQQLLKQVGYTLDTMPRTIPEMMESFCTAVSAQRVPVIIDEMDFLTKKQGMVELLLEAHQKIANPTILLIGEEKLRYKLAKWPKVHNRVRYWVEAHKINLDDVQDIIAADNKALNAEEENHPGIIDFDPKLLEAVGALCEWNTRRMRTNIDLMREDAQARNLTALGLGDYDLSKVYTGNPDQGGMI